MRAQVSDELIVGGVTSVTRTDLGSGRLRLLRA
jgi:hypothetical protein